MLAEQQQFLSLALANLAHRVCRGKVQVQLHPGDILMFNNIHIVALIY